MHPIVPMAVLTFIVALLLGGFLIWQLAPRDRLLELAILIWCGLAMSPLAFYLVRRPAIAPLEREFAKPVWKETTASWMRDGIRLLYAPLTEEPAKLLPWFVMLMLGVAVQPTRKMVAPLALAIGLSFALGEIALVAKFVVDGNDPKIAALPWYAFGGFFSERLMTLFAHSLFALPTLALIRKSWKWAPLGLMIGMFLHYCSNAPIVLLQREAFGIGKNSWAVIVQLWLTLIVVIALLAILWAHYGSSKLRRIVSAKMICPECGQTYRQPILLGLNMGLSRYERCAKCLKWHWVTIDNLAK